MLLWWFSTKDCSNHWNPLELDTPCIGIPFPFDINANIMLNNIPLWHWWQHVKLPLKSSGVFSISTLPLASMNNPLRIFFSFFYINGKGFPQWKKLPLKICNLLSKWFNRLSSFQDILKWSHLVRGDTTHIFYLSYSKGSHPSGLVNIYISYSLVATYSSRTTLTTTCSLKK